MTAYDHKGFFSQRKVLLMILLLIMILFFSYVAQFSLSSSEDAMTFKDIRYCFTSHAKVVASEYHMNTADEIKEIKKKASDKYIYIEAALPDTLPCDLVIRSSHATARISVAGEGLFDNMDGDRPSGSSCIVVPLGEAMAGRTLSILLYSPLSDSFDIRLRPSGEKLYTASNVPFAFFGILALGATLFLGCLFFCLTAGGRKMRTPTLVALAAFPAAIAVFGLEYAPLSAAPHILFNIKVFLALLVSTAVFLEPALRTGAWDTKTETILLIHILYAFCILLLGKNIFFFILLYSGIFLQAVDLLFVFQILTKHRRSLTDAYCVASIVFWCVDLLLWGSVALQKVTWQPLAFGAAAAIYTLVAVQWYHSENREERVKKPGRSSFLFRRQPDSTPDEPAEEALQSAPGAETPPFDRELLPIGELAGIPGDSREALAEFYRMIMKKVYGKDRHSFHVSEYSRIISYAMGMGNQRAARIAKAALLHDIGKICIPEHILFKIGRLTEEEFEEIKKHNIYGYQLLSSEEDEFFKMAALVARDHHEHMDGSGYLGLKGSDISIPAKIVAVADVFDALVSKRSYKEAWSFEGAVSYLSEHSGDFFDEDVVKSFIDAKDRIYELYLTYHPDSETGAEERG